MKITVDVKKVVQEINLDTGETHNFLVFLLGGAEHRVVASEDQLQRAITEAQMHQRTGNGAGYHASEPEPEHWAREEDPPEAPLERASGPSHFVEELLNEDEDDEEVAQAVAHAQSVFAEVGAPVTEEELAEFQGEGGPVLPMRVSVSSDEVEEGGDTFQEIMQHSPQETPTDPKRAKPPRKKELRGQQQTINALRARARAHPPRRLAPHQVDEAGNPVGVPQK
jgi:hypothetical protein